MQSEATPSKGDSIKGEEIPQQRRPLTGIELWRKLDLPLLIGEDAFAWVDRLEWFFHVRRIPYEEQMAVVTLALEGKALAWYH